MTDQYFIVKRVASALIGERIDYLVEPEVKPGKIHYDQCIVNASRYHTYPEAQTMILDNSEPGYIYQVDRIYLTNAGATSIACDDEGSVRVITVNTQM